MPTRPQVILKIVVTVEMKHRRGDFRQGAVIKFPNVLGEKRTVILPLKPRDNRTSRDLRPDGTRAQDFARYPATYRANDLLK